MSKLHTCRAELTLARADKHPLGELGGDPLASFAEAFSHLRQDLDESAEIAIDLWPVRAREYRRWTRRSRGVGRLAYRLAMWEPSRPRPLTELEHAERRAIERADASKVTASDALFAVQVLIRVRARYRPRAKQLTQELIAGFRPLTGANYFRTRWLTDQFPLRRRSFDVRMDKGVFMPPRHKVVTASEIAGLLSPPTKRCGPNVVRSGGFVPPTPGGLPEYRGERDTLPLGKVTTPAGERLACVRLADTKFAAGFGMSGTGKTEIASTQFLHLALRTPYGALLLDPHGEATHRLQDYLAAVAERVVVLDVSPAAKRVIGWNPLDMTGLAEDDVDTAIKPLLDAIAHVNDWSRLNSRAINLLQNALVSLAELGLVLKDRHDCQPTLFQVLSLLQDDAWREAVLPHLGRRQRDFWATAFTKLPADAVGPVTHTIYRMRESPQIGAMLGQSESAFNVRKFMDEGKLVLACTAATSWQETEIISAMLVFTALRAAKSRVDLIHNPEHMRPFVALLDELPIYDDGTVAELFEQVRKFKVIAWALSQDPMQLTAPTRRALGTNASHRLTGAVGPEGAAWLAKQWGDRVAAKTLQGLDDHSFVASVRLDGKRSLPFRLDSAPVRELFSEHYEPSRRAELAEVLDASRRSPRDVRAQQESLDARILEALRGRRRLKMVPGEVPTS